MANEVHLVMLHVKRTLPFVQAMSRIPTHRHRQSMLSHLPKFVVDDIAEIIYNIVIGNASISSQYRTRLARVKQQLYRIINQKDRTRRRQEIYKQSGTGVFTILLPAIASVISAIVGNALSKNGTSA